MRPYGYQFEKLMVAVDGLATGTDSIQRRLYYTYSSCFMRIREEDLLNSSIKEKFQSIYARLTNGPDHPEGRVFAATQAMTDDQAKELASDIYSLFLEIIHLHFGDE